MIKVTLEFSNEVEMLAYFSKDNAAAVAETAKVKTESKPAEVAKPAPKAKPAAKPAPKAAPVVEAVEEEVAETTVDREAVINEAREVCQALVSGANANEVGTVKAKILGVIKAHGGADRMTSIVDDNKLFDALAELKVYLSQRVSGDAELSFV